MDKLIILGAGDLGREVLYAAKENKASKSVYNFETIAFIDEDLKKIGRTLENVRIISLDDVQKLNYDSLYFICGIGNTKGRRGIIKKLLKTLPDARFTNVIHDSVITMPNLKYGVGNYIAPNTTIAIGTSLGDHIVINQNVSVGHDCLIGNYTVVSPGCILSGYTAIGDESFLGSGVVTYPSIRIGNNCTVSALTVVSRSLKTNCKLIAKPNTMLLKDK